MVQNSFSGKFYWITRHVGPVTEAIPSVILVHGKEALCVVWTNKHGHVFLELAVNLKQYIPLLDSLLLASKEVMDGVCIMFKFFQHFYFIGVIFNE